MQEVRLAGQQSGESAECGAHLGQGLEELAVEEARLMSQQSGESAECGAHLG